MRAVHMYSAVSLVGSTEDLMAEVERTGAHLVVANEVPPAARDARFYRGFRGALG